MFLFDFNWLQLGFNWFQLGVNSISIRFSLDFKTKKFKRALKRLLEAVLSDAFNKYPPNIQLLVGSWIKGRQAGRRLILGGSD